MVLIKKEGKDFFVPKIYSKLVIIYALDYGAH